MIELEVERYCDNCEYFEPVVCYRDYDSDNRKRTTRIRCERLFSCRYVHDTVKDNSY